MGDIEILPLPSVVRLVAVSWVVLLPSTSVVAWVDVPPTESLSFSTFTLDEPPEVTELPSDAFSVTTSLELTAALLSVSFTPCPVFTVVVEPSVPVVVDVFA